MGDSTESAFGWENNIVSYTSQHPKEKSSAKIYRFLDEWEEYLDQKSLSPGINRHILSWWLGCPITFETHRSFRFIYIVSMKPFSANDWILWVYYTFDQRFERNDGLLTIHIYIHNTSWWLACINPPQKHMTNLGRYLPGCLRTHAGGCHRNLINA